MCSRSLRVFGLVFVLSGCVSTSNGDDDGPPPPPQLDASTGNCLTLAGTWGITGSCGSDICTISQVGCAITALDCSSGAHSTSGSITGSQFTYTGESAGGTPATCTGTLTGNSIEGTCNIADVTTCNFSGLRR